MRASLMLLAAFLTVSAVSNQEKSEPQSSRISATRNAASLSDCGVDEQSGRRCHGTDFFCQYGSSQGVCLNDTCRCPEVPNRNVCTCLPQVGDCHITATSETSRQGYRNYSCIVPDNLNVNYDVHILSVYEASSNHFFRYHPTGTSYVSLSVLGGVVKPIVLVLVSYEPVEWRLSVPSGVEIERVLLSSFYLDDSRVVDTNNRVKTAEKVSRLEFPSGYGKDGGGGNTVKLLESTIARFGPIASFRGTYQANRWSLRITQRNHTYLPVCGYPPLPVNGTAILSHTSRGMEVEYSCFTGRTLKGAQSAICLEDRSWSAPAPTCLYTTQTTRTPTAAGTGITVIPAIAVPVILLVLVFIIVIVLCCCFCKKRHSSSASLPEQHTTHRIESLQNISNQRDHSVPIPGNTSDAANSQAINPGPPCPAYAAQDLPPDYYVVSKDNPPAYQTVMPTTQCQCPANPSVLPASAI